MSKEINVVVGVSGGVDSSVSALLLQQANYQVQAVFMKNWEEDDTTSYCPAALDATDAEMVMQMLNIPFQRINFAHEYWEKVFTLFLQEYQQGRTPNPDILCNKEIKFRCFLDYAKILGADFIATGHYAGKRWDNGIFQLTKAKDLSKDQSYFLYALNQEQLSKVLFPLTEINKKEVRNIAARYNLPTHNKKDSTGICFIGERNFSEFLSKYVQSTPGVIRSIDGKVIGQHQGLAFYTIGQRHGLNIGGTKGALELPWYVSYKDLINNELIVVQGEHEALYHKTLIAKDLNWIGHKPEQDFTCAAKIRYRQTDQECTVYWQDDNCIKVEFIAPQRAITPGQSIVFYQQDICLGGGIIQ